MNPWAIGMGLAGMYSKWRGARNATKNMNRSINKVREELAPWYDSLQNYKDLSNEYMDSTSGLNQSLLDQYQKSGMDFATAQNRMGSRNLSSGGLGGFSGLQRAMNESSFQKAQNQASNAWQQNLLNNRQTGVYLLDRYIQGQKGYSENLAQGWIQNDQLKRQMSHAGLSGIGSGLFSLASGIIGGGE